MPTFVGHLKRLAGALGVRDRSGYPLGLALSDLNNGELSGILLWAALVDVRCARGVIAVLERRSSRAWRLLHALGAGAPTPPYLRERSP